MLGEPGIEMWMYPPGEDLTQLAASSPFVPSARAASLISTIQAGTASRLAAPAPAPAPPQADEGENLLDRLVGGIKEWAVGQFGIGQQPPLPQDMTVMSGVAPVSLGIGQAALAAGGAAALALGTTALARTKFPWETATGEGMIAPWSEMKQLPSGEWVKEGWQGGTALPVGRLGTMDLQQLQNQVVNTWTNASKDGRSPATVMFVQYANGRVASQSLITGRIKTWRPKKHIVISTNPRVNQIAKLFRLSDRVAKKLSKNKQLMKQHSHAKSS